MDNEHKLNILVFGATRHTGYHFTQQALEAGHRVTAIVRNPSQYQYTHPNLTVVKGDALQIHTFEKEMHGKDVVVSTLGIAGFSEMKGEVTLCVDGVTNMLIAMHQNGVKRVVCISALPLDTNDKMGWPIFLASKFLQWLLKKSYDDMRMMEAALKSSHANWTVIRPPKLNDGETTGTYRIAIGEHLAKPWAISRANIAHYINHHLLDETTYQQIVEIAD